MQRRFGQRQIRMVRCILLGKNKRTDENECSVFDDLTKSNFEIRVWLFNFSYVIEYCETVIIKRICTLGVIC